MNAPYSQTSAAALSGSSHFPTSMAVLNAGEASAPVKGDRVAILTRTKDRPVLLARAFASMLAQTHHNWHLYLVNDGGDPAPVDTLVETYRTAFDGRISVIHHPLSRGMEAASNSALAGAEGDFVIVHDDDDSWHPEFLQETIGFLNRSGHEAYAAVLTNCTVVHERIDGDVVFEERREAWGYWRPQVDYGRMLWRNNFPPIAMLIRKSVVDHIGPFNANLPVLGDWDYNIRILQVGDIATIDRCLAYYHHRAPSEQSLYGNSVKSGVNRHETYDVLYRNSLLRQLLDKEPGFAGLLSALQRQMEEQREIVSGRLWDHEQRQNHQHNALQHRLWLLELELAATREALTGLRQATTAMDAVIPVLHSMNTALRPARWVWRRILPLRRVIARLRGRH